MGLRILAITNMYPSPAFPAQGVFVQEQVKGLRELGLEVEVMFVDRRREGPLAYYGLSRCIRPAVARFKPDAIHVMYGGVMARQVVRHAPRRPILVTFHGSDLLGENLSGWARRIISRFGVRCSRLAAQAADGVVLVARHLLPALHGAVPERKVRLIPCGIDLERFRPMERRLCQQRLGWDPRAFHVLFASSNHDPVKRPWLAKAAVAHLKAGSPRAELHFLTNVPNPEVPVWLNASDVLLLTSLHEGSPTIVKEALACGLPVVSVNVGDVAERIAEIPGCHLSPADPAGLAQRLEWVRSRPQRLDCHAQVAGFSILHIAQRLKTFCEELIGESRTVRSADAPSRPPFPAGLHADGRTPSLDVPARGEPGAPPATAPPGAATASRA